MIIILFNINLFKKGLGKRYNNWNNKMNLFNKYYENSTSFFIPTNFSQEEQTYFIKIVN
jgi:hypothetical protein